MPYLVIKKIYNSVVNQGMVFDLEMTYLVAYLPKSIRAGQVTFRKYLTLIWSVERANKPRKLPIDIKIN